MLEKALSKKTKAVMIAHTLGNPFNLQKVKEFCNKHNLWLIEDNCDSLGSKYNNQYPPNEYYHHFLYINYFHHKQRNFLNYYLLER